MIDETINTTYKVLGCPFCGGTAIKLLNHKGMHYVNCPLCCVDGPLRHTPREAVLRWNDRLFYSTPGKNVIDLIKACKWLMEQAEYHEPGDADMMEFARKAVDAVTEKDLT